MRAAKRSKEPPAGGEDAIIRIRGNRRQVDLYDESSTTKGRMGTLTWPRMPALVKMLQPKPRS